MKILKCKNKILRDVLNMLLLVFALTYLSFLCHESYALCMADSEHVNNGISIVSTILLGGIILFFIESQRHEEDIEADFVAVMQPFYHKLTLLLHFIYYCISAIDSNDEDKKSLMKLTNFYKNKMSSYQSHSILSGGDIPFLEAKNIDDLCKNVNAIWYMFDRSSDMRNLYFTYGFQLDQIKKSLSEYDTEERYKDESIDINILPKVCGDFYVAYWQPVQNTTSIYMHYKSDCQNFRRLICVALIIGLLSLISLFLFNGVVVMSRMVVDLMILVSVSLFVISLIQYLRIKRPTLK